MNKSFVLDVKTFSVNQMHYPTRKILTKEYWSWAYQVFHKLNDSEIQEKLGELRDAFDPAKNYYTFTLTALYPKSVYFTKAGQMSARIHDVTNWEKPLIDLMLLPKHTKKSVPYGVQNLYVDDKVVADCHSKKRPSPDDMHHICVSICIKDLDQLSEESSPEFLDSFR